MAFLIVEGPSTMQFLTNLPEVGSLDALNIESRIEPPFQFVLSRNDSLWFLSRAFGSVYLRLPYRFLKEGLHGSASYCLHVHTMPSIFVKCAPGWVIVKYHRQEWCLCFLPKAFGTLHFVIVTEGCVFCIMLGRSASFRMFTENRVIVACPIKLRLCGI